MFPIRTSTVDMYLFNFTILKLCDEKVLHLRIPITKVLLNKKTFIGYIRFCKLVIGINNMEFLCNVQINTSRAENSIKVYSPSVDY